MRRSFDLHGRFELGSEAAAGARIRQGQYLAASAVLRRLYGRLNAPGTILADEVGLGKTYVAFGVAAWLLANTDRPNARVLVLTNNRYMRDVWAQRWTQIKFKKGLAQPPAVCANGFQEYRDYAADKSKRLIISSYETLKRFGLDDWRGVRASIGAWLFKARHRPGTRFTKSEVRHLMRQLSIDLRIQKPTKLSRRISAEEARKFWKDEFDWDRRCWRNPDAARQALEDMEKRWGATGGYSVRSVPFDLVIVDEAHRLEAPQRQDAIRLLLHNRTRKILYVTATPFALDIGQLEDLLRLFELANGCDKNWLDKQIKDLDLSGFERAVDAGKLFPHLADLQSGLRKWIVRRSWAEESDGVHGIVMRRRHEVWDPEPDCGTGYAASLALERAIADLLLDGERTHIASRRAGLCSSWRAARRSFEENPLGKDSSEAEVWSRIAVRLIRDCGRDSPKIHEAVEKIAARVIDGKKVLVFSERSETLTLVRDLLRRHKGLRFLEDTARRTADRLRKKRLNFAGAEELSTDDHKALLRMVAGHAPGGALWKEINRLAKRWWHRSVPSLRDELSTAFGRRHSIRVVEVFDGERGDDSTISRFNMPGTPWVLLCSKQAQESIDLHHECNTVVLLDPVWNPACREQRIGRVQRVGSRFRDVRVIDVYTKHTYDQFIFDRAQKRAEMMSILLGAGRWLDLGREIENPNRYRIDLSPRSKLERELSRDD